MELGFVDGGQLTDFDLNDKKNKRVTEDNGRNSTGHNKMLLQ